MEKDKKKIKFFFVHLRKCVVNKEWWVGPDVRTRTEENVVYRYGDAVKREEKRKKKKQKIGAMCVTNNKEDERRR